MPGGMGLGTMIFCRNACKFLIKKGRRMSLYCAKTSPEKRG